MQYSPLPAVMVYQNQEWQSTVTIPGEYPYLKVLGDHYLTPDVMDPQYQGYCLPATAGHDRHHLKRRPSPNPKKGIECIKGNHVSIPKNFETGDQLNVTKTSRLTS